MTASAATLPARDARLDLFRGLAMLIIHVAHTPDNPWVLLIPARFGPSDGAEMFVFCSGFASALAFGGTFRRHGFGIGCLRVAKRCWQLYWTQFCLVLAVAGLVHWVTVEGIATRDYLAMHNLYPLFAEPARALLGLLTLTYVPNYFDILPMYIAVLAGMPIAVALARLDPRLPLLVSAALWLLAYRTGLAPPAEWWSDRTWFFSPLSWQLLFYTGFAFASGWIRPPAPSRELTWLALAVVVTLAPVSSWWPFWRPEVLQDVAEALLPWGEKQFFAPLRLVQFLALVYLALRLADRFPRLLTHPLAAPVTKVGQQALPVFVTSIVLAQVAGLILDLTGRGVAVTALVNLAGFAVLAGTAYLVAYVKAEPWRRGPAVGGSGRSAPGELGAERGREVAGAGGRDRVQAEPPGHQA